MLRFGKIGVRKEEFYGAKEPIESWNANGDNRFISRSIKTQKRPKYLIGYLDDVIRPLALILPKLSRYIRTVKDKIKVSKRCNHAKTFKENNLMSFRNDDVQLAEKYKIICTMIEDLQNVKLHAWPIYDGKYMKVKIRTYYNVYTNFARFYVIILMIFFYSGYKN